MYELHISLFVLISAMASSSKSQCSHRPIECFGSEARSDLVTIQKVSNRKEKADKMCMILK